MANRLINEQSQYLQQHAHNPVDWFPWGDEAFELAASRNVPVLVSIGYAACHWCHVMEHESFEDPQVAAYMNEHFVCIKVDREEHPDVDHFYMDAVQAIGGSGGWPLNVFATAERVPFYGGTYYPPRPAFNRPSWPQLLQRMNEVWHHQHDEVTLQAGQLLQHLQQASLKVAAQQGPSIDGEWCLKVAENLLAQADKEKGGFGNAPKFPGTMAISYLLEHYRYSGHQPSLHHALHSLDAMIDGGIYDQLGGGFARYSTDRDWLAPHFEKMLYDNALLILSLCDAYAITGKERYKQVIEETIAFAERELLDASGGYYCALDADSEGEEGKFYTWDWDDWNAAAGDSNGVAAAYYNVTAGGNWEGTNILHVRSSIGEVAAAQGVTEQEAEHILYNVRTNLLAARQKRIRPLTDDKCLLSWNALMNLALTRAGVTLGNQQYIDRAAAHMQWMLQAYAAGPGLLHCWKQGVARIPAKLDDYAYLIQAMLQLAQATGDNGLIVKATDMTGTVIEGYGKDDGYFYYTAENQKDIPVRKVDLYDGATPSANSYMAHNLLLCGMCAERADWIERAGRMAAGMAATIARYAYSFAYWGILLQREAHGVYTVVCSGTEATAAVREMALKCPPGAYLLRCEKEISQPAIFEKKYFDGNLSIFVCSKAACLPPVSSVGAALSLITK